MPPDLSQNNSQTKTDPQSIRAFTALTVPPSFKRQAAGLPETKAGNGRWTHPEDLHITLRYLGMVETDQLPDIHDALSRIRRPRFHIEARGMDLFENRRQAILFAEIQSLRKITTLVAEITDTLTPLGFDFGTRPYVPHVTLARFSRQARLQDYIRTHQNKLNDNWESLQFHLVRSGEPDDRGRRYEILSSYDLR